MVNNIVVCENLNSVMYVAREHPALRAIYLDGMKCDAFGSIEAYQRDAFAERDTSGAPNYAKRKAATDLHFPRSQTAIANWWPATFSPRPAREQTIAQMRDELNRLIREDVPIHEPEDFAMNTPGVAGDHQRVNEELAVMGVNAFKNFCEANQLLDIRIFEDRRTKLMEHEMHRIKREILVLKCRVFICWLSSGVQLQQQFNCPFQITRSNTTRRIERRPSALRPWPPCGRTWSEAVAI